MRRPFDLGNFCASIGAAPKEVNVVRDALVRGLKDYFTLTYGYDRYGAETLFMLPERMNQPYIFGFACRRILRDRRLSHATKVAAAQFALDSAVYGADGGLPYALLDTLSFLSHAGCMSHDDLRYGMVLISTDATPWAGVTRSVGLTFIGYLIGENGMVADERSMWAHSLLARTRDDATACALITRVLDGEEISRADRGELCAAWLHCRQPRFDVSVPVAGTGFRDGIVQEHMAFWIAHVPSWPVPAMVRLALVWLARGGAAAELAETYAAYRGVFIDEVMGAVIDIVLEHHETIPADRVRGIIEMGLASSGSTSIRRKFYGLGSALYGSDYVERAKCDPANSVRQWAVRQLPGSAKTSTRS